MNNPKYRFSLFSIESKTQFTIISATLIELFPDYEFFGHKKDDYIYVDHDNCCIDFCNVKSDIINILKMRKKEYEKTNQKFPKIQNNNKRRNFQNRTFGLFLMV